VTIPGKGGRPRKWRSDADRTRAYRARQRGEAEPLPLEQALADGDDLARLRQEIQRLALALRESRRDQRVLRAIVDRREREIVLLDEQLQAVRRVIEESWHERAELRRVCNELRAQLNRAAQGVIARQAPTGPVLPRHVRRQQERERRRR
jgi:chromosome segregation ATPase